MKTTDEMRQLLQRACKKAGGQRKWAEANGYTPQFVSMVLNADKKMPQEMGKLLGYKKMPDTWEPIKTKQ